MIKLLHFNALEQSPGFQNPPLVAVSHRGEMHYIFTMQHGGFAFLTIDIYSVNWFTCWVYLSFWLTQSGVMSPKAI